MEIARLMSGTAGRLARVVAGVVLVLAGLIWIGGVVGVIVAIIGLVPILAGAANVCLLAPLFGGPFHGPQAR